MARESVAGPHLSTYPLAHTHGISQDFSLLPDATKVTFQTAAKQDLRAFLPNRPPTTAESTCVDLIENFLAYPPSSRLTAVDALHHPWFTEASELLVPPGYPETLHDIRHIATWEGRTLSELLLLKLNPPHTCSYNTKESLN